MPDSPTDAGPSRPADASPASLPDALDPDAGDASLSRTDGASDAPDGLAVWGERDGSAGVPRQPSETLIAQSVARERIDEELSDVRERLDRVESTLDEVHDLRADVAATTAEIDRMETEQAEAEDTLGDVEVRLEAVQEEQAAQSSRGSVLYAVLYTVAGLFFVAGDVIMSREIVANALKLRGDVEPWIFAVGLGMLAVLLKPAYDRLVEKRWWKGKETAFTVVISGCALAAVGTLWVLGAFRSTAFVANSKMQRLTQELMETSDPARINEIQQQVASLQEGMIESPLGYWAFVFSGILFAVAGAVCLGIGIRHLRDAYHVRLRLYRAQKRLEAKRDDVESTLADLADRLPDARVRLRRLQQKVEDRPSLDQLRERRSNLRAAQRELRDHRAALESRRRQARYRRGHDHGRLSPVDPAQRADQGDGAPEVVPASPTDVEALDRDAFEDDRSYVALRSFLQRGEKD
jgi:predicted  nucleic acid-binding Zn-ribbon protein